ncbi:3-hydroxyacyl-CoA dehydrogenase NAD-binding domain-containing protein [Polymorphum gilvum]|uniref:Putative trifunctional protein n=1 Tax=Polymorphum gilvum (strain LMG 25793 / CGMCC 1.9160 / SL003B-26A1) TaxID=991905 RepID=F2IX06_POLGS|nr:3-hydroxyacyl-CoA dehydrogenase NAD-binding domain-containing protein [Polymorphum gilvum]ADZ71583.1 Putative trifunctional protein [Polymorphum gilvum SL003B-26A1]
MTDQGGAGRVHVERRSHGAAGTIAVVTIDFPPVNAGSKAMREAVKAAFVEIGVDGTLAGAVLTGAGGNFVGGADIREFDAPAQPPHLPEVIAAIEACPFPVVAAIDGAALGGGYELALGCDARVATPKAVVGLPEVTLGLIPGAGGTLRLSRLVDEARAIELVTSGRRVKAAEALDLGLVDAVANGDLIEAAVTHLATLGGQKRRLRDQPVVSCAPAAVERAATEATKKGRGAEAVAAAITAIRDSVTLPVDEALARERETSLRLRREPQSQALRHLFFAEKAAMKLPEGATPLSVRTVGVVGAGRMGQGIVLAFARRGFTVHLAERDPSVLAAGLSAIGETAASLEAEGRIPSAAALMETVLGGDVPAMADCDLVVEAIFEDMDAKKALFGELDKLLPETAILATNTSYLDINEIAAATARPERVGGLHFFNPAHVMRLIEVVRADRTSLETLSTLLDVGRRIGKLPVVARVGEGFIGNRIFAAYREQCEFLIEEGAYPQDVDRAMRAFGMAMGPFAVFDLAGLDISWARRKRLAPLRDPKNRYVEIADRLCEAGRFGRKTGMGWYLYPPGSRGDVDPQVTAVIEACAASKGIVRRTIPDDEIRARLLASMVNEAALLLGEGIAERASDVDLVLVNGYGFPALKGGPLHWAARQPRTEFLTSVDAMVAASGPGVKRAGNLEAVLTEAERL